MVFLKFVKTILPQSNERPEVRMNKDFHASANSKLEMVIRRTNIKL